MVLVMVVSFAAIMNRQMADGADLTLAVVSADRLARAGLASLLAEQEGLRLIGQFPLEVEPEAVLPGTKPELAVLDLTWEEPESQEAVANWIETLRWTLLLVPADRPPGPLWGLGPGGLIDREQPAEAIAAAAQAIASGLLVLDPQFSRPALAGDVAVDPIETLSDREWQVLQLLAKGRSNLAIAEELGVSESTVKFHVSAILGKLGAESRTEAAVIAARAGLVIL
jgi:DNA-binding NarL/FixJ family response regulator